MKMANTLKYIISFFVKNGLYFKLSLYEKVSDQGPVWVRSEDKIPSDFISIHDIYIWLPEYSSVP